MMFSLTTLDSVLFSFVEKFLVLMNCQLFIQDSALSIFALFTIETFVKIEDSDAVIQFCNKSSSLFFCSLCKNNAKNKVFGELSNSALTGVKCQICINK